jgi:Carboxypeptidase regulatory-like domain
MIFTFIQRLLKDHFRGALLLILLMTFLSAVGQIPTPPVSTAQPSKVGSIKGRVVNESGQRLPNAHVSITALGLFRQNQSTITDRDGNFEVSGLEPLSYQVFAWLSAYAPVLKDLDVAPPPYYRVGDFVTIVLVKGGVITGTVTSQTGEPVVGVRVRAKMISDSRWLPFPYGVYVPERMTDDRGVYRIYGLPGGTYVVWAGGDSERSSDPDPFDADVPTYAPASTHDTAAEITVRAGAETSNVNIRYRGEPGHVVSGRALGPPGTAAAGFRITLTSVAGGGQWNAMSVQPPESKNFVFSGIDDGDYDVAAMSFQPDGEWFLSTTKRITVRSADVTGIELVTEPLSSVNGRVVLEESKAIECTDKQRPLFTETLVFAERREKEASKNIPHPFWPVGRPVNSDVQGNVSLKYLMPGQYYFVPQSSGKYWYPSSILLAAPGSKTIPVNAARTWTTIKPGDRLSGLTITLAQGAASLRGQVAIGEGETLPERLFVYLVPAEREKADDVLRFYAAAVSADGKIALNNLAPGRYWIFARPDGGSSPLSKLRLPDETERRSALRRDAEAAKNEIEFKPCQNVVDFKLGFKQ